MRKRSWRRSAMAVCLAIAMAIMMMPMAAMAAPGTTVYLNSSSGDDANDGLSAANAVKTLDKALELAGEGGTILLGSTVFISDDRTLEGVTISRAEGFTATMLVVSGSATLTLQNVTLDGANVANSYYLVQVSSGSTLNIGADAVLENNQHTAVYAYNATVNMTGGTIRNNKVTGDGGGMCLFNSKAELSGGFIEENEAVLTDQDVGGGGAGVLGYGSTQLTISGTTIRNNTADTDGAGVYMWTSDASGQDASFTMTSGAVTGNETLDGYAGIYLRSYGSDIKASVSGGTITNNTDQDDNDTAIQLADYNDKYIVLELSGAPDITGEIQLIEGSDAGPYIQVTGDLQVKTPIPVGGIYYNIPSIRYADGVTPDLNDFVSAVASRALAVEGQNLVWVKKINVSAYTRNWETGKWEQHSGLYMMPGQPLDQSLMPQAAEYPGYERIGWQVYQNGQWVLFDLERNLTMDDNNMRLYEIWALKAPTDVKITADTTSLHPGKSITLKATASHDLQNVVYNYAWYKDGVLIDGQTTDTLTVTEAGSYTVKVSVSNGNVTSAEVESQAIVCDSHSLVDGWQSDENNHWHACTSCQEKLDLAAHVSDEGKVTTAPTETTTGVKTYSCTICGRVLKTETIPAVQTPQTGETGSVLPWIALLTLGMGGVVAGVVLQHKKRNA